MIHRFGPELLFGFDLLAKLNGMFQPESGFKSNISLL